MPRPLDIVPEWIERHCVVPDGDDQGSPMFLVEEQLAFVVNHYMVRDEAKVGQRADAFVYRRSQLVRAQKWGKSPLIAAFVCAEAVGPVLFDGWAVGGEVYRCAEHGCSCGWGDDPDDAYVFMPGEPMGRPWPTALIQVTATTEDQTDNTYGALRPMIEKGPLAEVIPRTGEEFIRLPSGGRIEVVTSKATSRLGQRVTFVPQDETGIWTASNSMVKVARTQRRGLAGMGGRAIETTNAWDPSEKSVAQMTFETQSTDVHKDFRQPPPDLKWSNRRDRQKILRYNYAGVPWTLANIGSIEAEAAELSESDPAEAERFFGNRIVAGGGAWMPRGRWEAAYAGRAVAPEPA